MSVLVSVLLLAAPAVGSTWKGNWSYSNELVATATAGGKKHKKSSKGGMRAVFTARVEAANEKRATELAMVSNDFTIGAFSLRDDGGAARVLPKRKLLLPSTQEAVPIYRSAYGMLVLDDPERKEMETCGNAGIAATERWLMRRSALMFDGDVSETKLANVVVTCAAKKGRAVYEVAWDALVGVGMVVYAIQAKGSVTVDPEVWVTTWNFGGPLAVDSNSRTELKVKGTFKSRFELSK
jgi:hypothetical protein